MDNEVNGTAGIAENIASLRNNIKKHVKGKDSVIDDCICALFSNGHMKITE